MRVKTFFINIIILCSAVLISLLICEALCRLLEPLKIGAGHNKIFCEYDELLGWKKKANTAGRHKEKEYSVLEEFNSKGLRGTEYSYQKNCGYRILILGDSFAEGYAVEFSELFSKLLEDKLKEKGIDCEVINAGTGGYSTDQELLFFQNEGKKYSPDLTMLMFYENDVWYNNQPRYARGYKPYFKYSGGQLVLTNVPVPREGSYLSGRGDKNCATFFGCLKAWLRNKSYLYNILMTFIDNRPSLYNLVNKIFFINETKEGHSVPSEFMVWRKNYPSEVSQAWKITGSLIDKLKEETAGINSTLLVCYVPTIFSVYPDQFKSVQQKYGISGSEWDIDQPGIELERICGRASIDFINPTRLFREEAVKIASKGEALYFMADGHWNTLGNAFVSGILADFIYSKYLIK